MTNQQGAPEALTVVAPTKAQIIEGLRAVQSSLGFCRPHIRDQPERTHWDYIDAACAALVEAQQPAPSAAAADPCPGCIPGSYCKTPKCGRLAALNAAPRASSAPVAAPAFQQRVQPWLLECFGAEIAADRMERNHRFLEESLELVQSLGCTASEAHQLVDYVFGRPVGDPPQEVGGVMVTLAALCLASGLDMHDAGEVELVRINAPELVAKIRAKQAAKPKHSPLPQSPTPQADSQPAPVRNLQWTQDTPPTHGICSYDHCTAQTPLGPFRIEWKSWKEHDARCLYLNGEYIGCAASTDDAKQLAQGHIESIAKELAPYRAARAPADSVTEPAGGVNWAQLRSALAMLMLGWGRNPNQTMDACYRVLDSATEPGTALAILRTAPDWRDFMAADRAKADSVLEDAQTALRKVLGIVQRYLLPDGPSAHDAMSEITAIVDPWPLGPLEKP